VSAQTIEEVVPLNGTGTDAIMTAVRKVLDRGDATAIYVSAGDSAIRYDRVATDEEAEQKSQLTYHAVLRTKPMEEYVPDEDLDPYKQMFEMFSMLEDAGFQPLVLLSGRPVPKLRKWLDLMSRRSKTVFGVRVHVEESIPEDCLILCGSDGAKDAGPESVRFSVKVTLP
jgi:hypothetical protein